MARTILLANSSADSTKAIEFLDEHEVSYELLKADVFWAEIDWPIPTLFHLGEAWKGIEEITDVVLIISTKDDPN